MDIVNDNAEENGSQHDSLDTGLTVLNMQPRAQQCLHGDKGAKGQVGGTRGNVYHRVTKRA